jgi:hypothetical protein
VDLLHIVLRMARIVRLRYCFALRERERESDYAWRMVRVDEEALGDGRIPKIKVFLIFITRKDSLIIKCLLQITL